mmetsp:Transcript_18436/g.52873  ORF Transcript_18436/g.52873 Transcript_18436/m.52873 type:complete len:288 (-) Transcript_18436:2370-3233(-)
MFGKYVVGGKVGPLFIGRQVWGDGRETFPVGLIATVPVVVCDASTPIVAELTIGSSTNEVTVAMYLELGGQKVKAGRHATYVDVNKRSMPGLRPNLNSKVLVSGCVRVRGFQRKRAAVAFPAPKGCREILLDNNIRADDRFLDVGFHRYVVDNDIDSDGSAVEINEGRFGVHGHVLGYCQQPLYGIPFPGSPIAVDSRTIEYVNVVRITASCLITHVDGGATTVCPHVTSRVRRSADALHFNLGLEFVHFAFNETASVQELSDSMPGTGSGITLQGTIAGSIYSFVM